jgi:hypothetical protein
MFRVITRRALVVSCLSDHQEGLGGVMFRVITRRALVV